MSFDFLTVQISSLPLYLFILNFFTQATILLVGYFVLGPSDLYKLVKEIGKFIQNVRTLGTEATKTFENTMESQLELLFFASKRKMLKSQLKQPS